MTKAPKSPAKAVSLELVKGDSLPSREGKLCIVELRNPLIPEFVGLEQIGQWLRTEVQAFERDERNLTLRMVRIGMVLVWVEKTQVRGTQANLMRLHFSNNPIKTLERYIAAAKKVMRHLDLLKGNTLTDAAELGKVVMIQPDLFDDAETLKHNAVLQKVSDFIGGRSLTSLLNGDGPLALGDPDLKAHNTPNGHQKDAAEKRALKTPEMKKRETFEARFIQFQASFKAEEWHYLFLHGNGQDTIGKLDLEKFLTDAAKKVAAHNREEALKQRRK